MKNKFLKLNKLTDKYIYEKNIIYILIFLLSLIIPTIFILEAGEFWNVSDIVIYSIEIILSLIDMDLIIFNIIKSENKFEHLFLSLMIPIGLSYLITIIPNYVYDEGAHAYRTYVISKGHIVTDRDSEKKAKMEVPRDLVDSLEISTYKDLVIAIKTKTDYNDTVIVGNDGVGASTYPFICYIFPAVGMTIGNIFNLNIIISYYLARIFSFIGFLLLSYYSLKILPIGKLVMFVYLFNPILIQQCSSMSADCLINSISLFLVSFIFSKFFSKKEITDKQLCILAFLSCSLAIMKYVYFPLSLLTLLLIKNNKTKTKKIIGIIIASIICAVILYIATSKLYINKNSYILSNNISSAEQIKFILKNPISFIKVIIYTTITNFEFYFFTLFSRNLGNYTIQVSNLVSIIYAYILLLAPFLEKNKFELKKSTKILLLLIVIMIYGLIEVGLYLGWTKTGASVVEGVQGRYFIPIVFLIPILFIKKNNELKFKNRNIYICATLIFVNLIALFTIVKYFNY